MGYLFICIGKIWLFICLIWPINLFKMGYLFAYIEL